MSKTSTSDGRDNKDNILRAAEKLIQKRGVAATSLSDIAASAGIAKGTLHYYYRSKADLLFELAERQGTIFSERFIELTRKKLNQSERDESIRFLVTEIIEHTNNFILIHLIMEGVIGNTDLKKRFRQLYTVWSATIKQGLEQLCGCPVSSDEADFVLSSLIGMLFDAAVKGKSIDPDVFRKFIFKGLGG
jgi:AcrR family transcriptional regulator